MNNGVRGGNDDVDDDCDDDGSVCVYFIKCDDAASA